MHSHIVSMLPLQGIQWQQMGRQKYSELHHHEKFVSKTRGTHTWKLRWPSQNLHPEIDRQQQ